MGVWAYPNSVAKADRLERLMAAPIPASRSQELYDIVGDDTFLDMVGAKAADEDIRPLVAITVDEWVNWSAPQSFLQGAIQAGRLRDLIAPYRDLPLSEIHPSPVTDGTAEAAVGALWAIVGQQGAPVDTSRFDVAPGFAPATHAMRDRDTGKVYRFEHVYGAAFAAAPDCFAADGAIFEASNGPRLP